MALRSRLCYGTSGGRWSAGLALGLATMSCAIDMSWPCWRSLGAVAAGSWGSGDEIHIAREHHIVPAAREEAPARRALMTNLAAHLRRKRG